MYMAILCFEKRIGLASERHGSELAYELRRLLSLERARELKYRLLRKRIRSSDLLNKVVELLRSYVAAWICTSIHVIDPSKARVELLRKGIEDLSHVLRGGEVSILILDVQSIHSPRKVFAELRRYGKELGITIRRIEMRSSSVVDGIQLADLLAGLCRDGLVAKVFRG